LISPLSFCMACFIFTRGAVSVIELPRSSICGSRRLFSNNVHSRLTNASRVAQA
jgi:hypothetical protein